MAVVERQLIQPEMVQRQEEGCDISVLEPQVLAAIEDESTQDQTFVELYDELIALKPDPSFSYEEPSELDEIKALRPPGPRRMDGTVSEQTLRDRIFGGWLGRAAGCSLGKPVEGWPRERIDEYLANTNAFPLDDYIPFSEGAISQYLKASTRGNIKFMARDDDMDYPILGLISLERSGSQLSPRDMANTWLSYMPFNMLYTAENVAYRNLVNRRWPPESASWRNPFREWIGAQIRADIFGYVAPGWPEKAAELAYQDACISHVKNGIYGEILMAAMIAASFATDDMEQIIDIGLSEIPANCRLAEAVHDTVSWCKESNDWEVVWDRIFEKYGHYHRVHTINNAALVVMGLMFGQSDYEQGIVLSVRGGWDTDCNGATVGSILGTKMGAEALPEKWIGVLSNRLMSVVRDFNDNQISDLADRTYQMAMTITNGD
ncbi:MAG: ADP-ribosylglycohydrolase family protein [Gammaproteobacteria bacterium]|nr:ADP-ribosylglycohydrolase family protein [Gammaproteobacteria bacterium]